jgi:hypothetical protein
MDQIAVLDEDGIPLLVAAMASEREAVARAAKSRLLDRLEQGKSLAAEKCALRFLRLAEALAGQVGEFGPAARSDAADLATRILLSPAAKEGSADRARLIAACDEVFHAALADRGESPLRERSARQGEDDFERPLAIARMDADKKAAVRFDPLPGGGLPIDAEPAEQRNSSELPSLDNGEIPPSYFQAPSNSRQLDFSNRPANPMQVPESPPQSIPKKSSSGTEWRIKPTSLEASIRAVDQNPLDLRTLATLDLMRQLCDAENDRAKLLEAELMRRGLSSAEIGLGRRMFDVDPAVRIKLVAELPGTPGIDASEWLLQCCKDEDAEVRLAAFSLLATSRNPLLLQKVKGLAQNDSDPRIQRQAEKMAEEGKR